MGDKVDFDIEKVESQLFGLFRAHRVSLAYLFGSYAKGKIGPMSDLDIAILLKGGIPEADYFNLRIDMMVSLSSIFKRGNIEVVILNKSAPLLKYEVIKYGRVLFKENEASRVNFEAHVLGEYLDTKRIRDLNYRAIIQRLKEGRLGEGSRGYFYPC